MAARRRARRRDGAVAEPARDDRPAAGTLPGDRAAVGHAAGKRAPGTHPGVLPAPAARPRPRRSPAPAPRPPAPPRPRPAAATPARCARRSWAGTRHGTTHVPQDAADAVDTILYEWGPRAHPGEHSRYACSPHRIEMAAHLIRDGYFPDYANAALRLLPEWTQWCIEQSGLTGDFAARSRAAALTEAAALVDEETDEAAGETEANRSAAGSERLPSRERHGFAYWSCSAACSPPISPGTWAQPWAPLLHRPGGWTRLHRNVRGGWQNHLRAEAELAEAVRKSGEDLRHGKGQPTAAAEARRRSVSGSAPHGARHLAVRGWDTSRDDARFPRSRTW